MYKGSLQLLGTLQMLQLVCVGLHGSFTNAYLGPPLDDPSALLVAPREHDIRKGVSVSGVPKYSGRRWYY